MSPDETDAPSRWVDLGRLEVGGCVDVIEGRFIHDHIW